MHIGQCITELTHRQKNNQSEFTILRNKHLFGLWAQTHTGSTDELYLCYWIKFKFHCSVTVWKKKQHRGSSVLFVMLKI